MNIATPEGMQQAVAWQRNMLSVIKDGGVWVVPCCLAVIKIFHSTKTAVFVTGRNSDIIKVFTAMGWTVQEPAADQQSFSA